MHPNYCPVCRHKDTIVFLEVKDVPVHCNILWSSREAALTAPRGDVRLGFCRACGMISNVSFDPGRTNYAGPYENSLHFSPRFQTYARALATRLIKKYDLWDKDVIEIGCGKGEFLSLLCQMGHARGLGFDPSYDGPANGGRGRERITVIRDVYTDAYAGYPAKLICCRHVLEHLHGPREFLLALRRAIGDRRETVVFFEVPNGLHTLHGRGIWDIIYEHCSYFSPVSLTRLFQETGFAVRRLRPSFGDQFLCLEAAPAVEPLRSPRQPALQLRKLADVVWTFADAYQHEVRKWEMTLGRLLSRRGRVVVWGAGSKGVTFLNTVRGADWIEYVIDINPRKQGMYIPGGGQPIVSPEMLAEHRPSTVLVMNPIYQDEIRGRLSRMGIKANVLAV